MIDSFLRTYRPSLPKSWIGFVVVCFVCANGCATQPYRYGSFSTPEKPRPTEVAFEYGEPNKVLDGMAWFTGLWSRLLTLNKHVNNHEFSEATRDKLISYMEENELEDVLVRINQYDPKGEWRRLRENKLVAPGYKYTMGILSLAGYTILPGRVFGGDEYNPYTNSLYINSDVAAIALHEAAYAKDIHARSYPGGYAMVNEIPMAAMWRHTNGINDVLGYARLKDDWKLESETYRVIYPQMGVYSTAFYGSMLPFWDGLLLSVAGATAGHVTGQIALTQRKRQIRAESSDLNHDYLAESNTGRVSLRGDRDASAIQVTNHQMESDEEESP